MRKGRKQQYRPMPMSGEDDALSLPDTDNGGSLSAQARLRIALMLNLSYTFAELAAYYSFDSLAMLTDAVHNLSDVVAIVVAYRIEMLKNDPQVRRLQHGAPAPAWCWCKIDHLL